MNVASEKRFQLNQILLKNASLTYLVFLISFAIFSFVIQFLT